jgi:hypothetical protein
MNISNEEKIRAHYTRRGSEEIEQFIDDLSLSEEGENHATTIFVKCVGDGHSLSEIYEAFYTWGEDWSTQSDSVRGDPKATCCGEVNRKVFCEIFSELGISLPSSLE